MYRYVYSSIFYNFALLNSAPCKRSWIKALLWLCNTQIIVELKGYLYTWLFVWTIYNLIDNNWICYRTTLEVTAPPCFDCALLCVSQHGCLWTPWERSVCGTSRASWTMQYYSSCTNCYWGNLFTRQFPLKNVSGKFWLSQNYPSTYIWNNNLDF